VHIGLIGGIGPAATAYYYQGLTRAAASAGHRLELTLAHAQLPELVENMLSGTPEKTAQSFAVLDRRLAAAGADGLAITSIAGHFCIAQFEVHATLAIVNAIPAIATELIRQGCRRVGLLGTQMVMESHLYGGLADLAVVTPPPADLMLASRTYMDMASAGAATDAQREALFSIGRDLGSRADVVLLAGTDLFLAFSGYDCGFSVIDSADIHINAIFEFARGSR